MKIKKSGILCVFVMLFSLIQAQAQPTISGIDSLSSNNLLAQLQVGTVVEGDLYHYTDPVIVTFDPYVNYYRWILTDPIYASVIPPLTILELQDSLASVTVNPSSSLPSTWGDTNDYMYEIIVTAQDGSENKYYINGVYAIGQTELEAGSVSMYPNPSTGIVNVEVAEGITDYTIEVISTTGQQVFFSEYEHIATQTTLDLSDVENGMYYVILRDTQSGKFTKEKITILK